MFVNKGQQRKLSKMRLNRCCENTTLNEEISKSLASQDLISKTLMDSIWQHEVVEEYRESKSDRFQRSLKNTTSRGPRRVLEELSFCAQFEFSNFPWNRESNLFGVFSPRGRRSGDPHTLLWVPKFLQNEPGRQKWCPKGLLTERKLPTEG